MDRPPLPDNPWSLSNDNTTYNNSTDPTALSPSPAHPYNYNTTFLGPPLGPRLQHPEYSEFRASYSANNTSVRIGGTMIPQNTAADLSTPPMTRWRVQSERDYITKSMSDVNWLIPGARVERIGNQFESFRSGPASTNGSYTTYPNNDSTYGTLPPQVPSVHESGQDKALSHHEEENQSLADGLQMVRIQGPIGNTNSQQQGPAPSETASQDVWRTQPPSQTQRHCDVPDCTNQRAMNPSEFKYISFHLHRSPLI